MNEKTISTLKSLVQLDYDAVLAYNQALDHIDLADVHKQIADFRDDHERHITELSALLRDEGEDAPARGRDLKGFFIEGFTAVRSVTGTEGALKAMKTNEELTNRRYESALTAELSTDARKLVEKNFHDEQRHLRWIEKTLAERPWQAKGAAR
jgi:rubrerythrin